jgi:large subunit ribosomal protein L19e
MKLEKKKELVARTLDVGKARIRLNPSRLSEIKEAITKQDIRDLLASGAIIVLPGLGRKKVERKQKKRTPGKVRMRIVDTKRRYITLTRKFRSYLFTLRKTGKISEENYLKLRKEIKASVFRDINHLKERILQI